MKFEVVKETENSDGSLSLECEIDDDFKAVYKKATGKKRATQRGMEKWIIEMITLGAQIDPQNKDD